MGPWLVILVSLCQVVLAEDSAPTVCVPECAKCSQGSPTFCVTCAVGRYYAPGGQCFECGVAMAGCVKCATATQCTQCGQGLVLRDGRCQTDVAVPSSCWLSSSFTAACDGSNDVTVTATVQPAAVIRDETLSWGLTQVSLALEADASGGPTSSQQCSALVTAVASPTSPAGLAANMSCTVGTETSQLKTLQLNYQSKSCLTWFESSPGDLQQIGVVHTFVDANAAHPVFYAQALLNDYRHFSMSFDVHFTAIAGEAQCIIAQAACGGSVQGGFLVVMTRLNSARTAFDSTGTGQWYMSMWTKGTGFVGVGQAWQSFSKPVVPGDWSSWAIHVTPGQFQICRVDTVECDCESFQWVPAYQQMAPETPYIKLGLQGSCNPLYGQIRDLRVVGNAVTVNSQCNGTASAGCRRKCSRMDQCEAGEGSESSLTALFVAIPVAVLALLFMLVVRRIRRRRLQHKLIPSDHPDSADSVLSESFDPVEFDLVDHSAITKPHASASATAGAGGVIVPPEA